MGFTKAVIRQGLLVAVSMLFTNCGWLGGVFTGNGSLSNTGGNNSTVQNPGNTQTPPGNNNGTGRPSLYVNVGQPVVAGICTPANVVALNSSSQISNVLQNTAVTLLYPSGMTVHTSSNCTSGSVITQTTIAQGSASAPFFILSNTPGAYAMTATVSPSTDYDPHTLSITISQPAFTNIPVKIGLSGSNVIGVGSCAPYLSTFLTSADAPTVFNSGVTVSLSGAGVGGSFYSDAACSNAIASYNVAAGNPNGAFYFKSNQIGAPILVAVASGISGSLPVYVERGAPHHLSFFGPNAINNQDCVGMGVVIRDLKDNAVVTTSNLIVSLSKGSGEPGEFYADQNCSLVASSITVLSYNSSQQFFYKSTDGGVANLRASASLVPNDGTMALQINQTNPGSPARLYLSIPSNQTSAGNCFGPLNVSVRDSALNVIVNPPVASVKLTTSGSGVFFSDSACGNSISTVNSGTNFYFRDLVAESSTLKADHNVASPLYASDTKGLTISAGPATNLKLSALATTFVAGQCYEMKVVYQDSFGNASPLSTSSDVNLSRSFVAQLPATPPSGVSPVVQAGQFYSNSSCSSVLPSASGSGQLVNLSAGVFEKSVYFKENLVGNGTLMASDGVRNPGSFNYSVAAGVGIQLVVSPPSVIPSGACSIVQAYLVDAFYNVAPALSDMVFSLSQSPNLGSYYGNGQCNGSVVSSFTLLQGASSVSFGYIPSVAGPQNGTGTASTTTPAISATFPISVIAGVADRLQLMPGSGTPSSGGTGLVGVCYPFTIQSFNAANQVKAVTADTVIPLAPAGFYGDASCSLSISQAVLLNGSSQVVVYFRSTIAAARVLSTGATGFVNHLYSITFVAGAPAGLAMSGASTVQAGVCSDVVEVKAVDIFGNYTALPAMTISLGGNPSNVSYYNAGDFSCSGPSIGSILIGSGGLGSGVGVNFRVKSNVSQVVAMSASGGSLSAATRNMTIIPGAYSSLALSVSPLNLNQLVCSGPITARASDLFGNSVVEANARSVSITPSGGVAFYSDATCSTVTGAAVIAVNEATSAPVYAKGVNAGSFPQVFSYLGVSATLQANIALVDCRSPSALVNNSTAYFARTDMEVNPPTYQRYIAIKPLFPTWDPYGRAGGSTGGVSFSSDDDTHQAMCNFMGYQSRTGTRVTNSWSSPGDNGAMRFYPATKQFKQVPANQNNYHTNGYYCVGKLMQSCYDDPTWIAR